MIYMEYKASCRRAGGEVRCRLVDDGLIHIVVEPDPKAANKDLSEYYGTTSTYESRFILSARAAEDLVTVVNRCLAEMRRQDAEATGTPVTDGHGMEAIVPPTDVVPMLAIHREYAVIGGEG